MEFSVLTSMAGVTGPCPGCGQILAAPSPPPSVLPDEDPVIEHEPPVPGAREPGSGYKAPTRVAAPPALPVVREKPNLADQIWMGLPMCLMFVGGVIGGAIGGVAYGINRKLFEKIKPLPLRYLVSGVISVAAVFLWIVVAGGLYALTHKDEMARAFQEGAANAGAMGSYRERQLATVRAQVKKQLPNVYSEADFDAADSAAMDVPDRDVLDVYMKTLRDHLSVGAQ